VAPHPREAKKQYRSVQAVGFRVLDLLALLALVALVVGAADSEGHCEPYEAHQVTNSIMEAAKACTPSVI
jgi:hypothetical protein